MSSWDGILCVIYWVVKLKDKLRKKTSQSSVSITNPVFNSYLHAVLFLIGKSWQFHSCIDATGDTQVKHYFWRDSSKCTKVEVVTQLRGIVVVILLPSHHHHFFLVFNSLFTTVTILEYFQLVFCSSRQLKLFIFFFSLSLCFFLFTFLWVF